ncbi:hypothetical protein EPA93_40860 [Ktedonosporobacter rubrisoli]|uniref:Uncharacterized protein n=1 Tax=Ktedonosporobacter rubrisoli TaxID=2509675 RepID=A0A4P6K2C2_KTERU|nr:hypothetical protein [Ktedonosporobacter rubrisoli]QBD81993.1 hypothetical protein EPA93_40860 [Ktedonosporobacter rubrisoli]
MASDSIPPGIGLHFASCHDSEKVVGRIMGQYRLWLHYREVDQQLRAQLKRLEEELAQLQEQVNHQQDSASYENNTIIRALSSLQHDRAHFEAALDTSSYLASHAPAENIPAESSEPLSAFSPAAQVNGVDQKQLTAILSQALFAWSKLPNFDTGEMQMPSFDFDVSAFSPPTPRPEADLLPEDIAAFFTTQGEEPPPTLSHQPPHPQPEAELPSSAGSASTSPVDKQSMRTNQLIQRWFERWGQRSNAQSDAGEEQPNE